MLPYATGTLTLERHGSVIWLVALYPNGVDMLAQFSDEDAAQTFKRLFAGTIAQAHAAGMLGI